MLHRTGRPERLLIVGKPGTGKTNAYMTIASWLHNTGAPGQVFVIDPDLKARYDPGANLPNVHIYDELEYWTDYKTVSKKVREQGDRSRDDWCVLDMANRVWDAAQAGYAEMAFGQDVDDFYVAWRKDHSGDKGGNPFNADWGKDWQAINRLYDTFMFNITRFPGNVIITTAADPLSEQEKDPEVIRKYSQFGVKPAGQKRLGYLPADELLFQQKGNGWVMTQMRGTGREGFKGEALNDFCLDYLMKHGGWSLD